MLQCGMAHRQKNPINYGCHPEFLSACKCMQLVEVWIVALSPHPGCTLQAEMNFRFQLGKLLLEG